MKDAPTQPVTFYSKYKEYQVVMLHDHKMLVDNQIFNTPSRTIEFSHARLTTDDQEVISFLRNHPAFGLDFFETEALVTADQNTETPVAPSPEAPPTVAKPVRTKKGERAAVVAKPTTADEVLSE